MALWDDVLSDRDRRVLARTGHAARRGLGTAPVVLVVDAQEHFVGLRDDVLASVEVYPTSVGREAWDAVAHIQRLLAAARGHGIPVMYSRSGVRAGEERFDSFRRKRSRALGDDAPPTLEIPIVAELAPHPGDVVIEKRHPSAFFGTPLMSFLNRLRVDTILLAGFTTSGCVRATCVDAMSYDFNVGVIAEGCADRLHLAHKASLLDMHMKYADVISLEDALSYLARLRAPEPTR